MSLLLLVVFSVFISPRALLESGVALGDKSPMLWLIGGVSTPDF